MESIFFYISCAFLSQGNMYLSAIYSLHEQLNSGIKALIAKNSNELLEYHNNQGCIGSAYRTVSGGLTGTAYIDTLVGAKNLVLYELDGTDIKYGGTTKSINISSYVLQGICQTDTGWMTYYGGNGSPTSYRFRLYDSDFATVTTWDLTAPSGTLCLYPWSLFAFDGTNVYFQGQSSSASVGDLGGGSSIVKVTLASSVVEYHPFESFLFYGTTKYKLYDHIAKSASKTYYFDELFQGLRYALIPTCAFFDGTYFYFKEATDGNKTVIAKKVL